MRTSTAIAIVVCLELSGVLSSGTFLAAQGAVQTQNTTSDDRYGDVLPDAAVLRLGTIRLRHAGSPYAVAFSPDGKTLASAGSDRPVRIWNIDTGQLMRLLIPDTHYRTLTIDISPDGAKLVTAGEAGLVRLWDLESGQELWSRLWHEQDVCHAVFSPDGQTCATASEDGTVRMLSVETGHELLLLSLPPIQRQLRSYTVAFSPDGNLLAAAAKHDIHLFKSGQSDVLRVIRDAHGGEIFSLSFTPDGRFLASGGRSVDKKQRGGRFAYAEAETRLWNVADGSLARQYLDDDPDLDFSIVSVSRDGRLLISMHADKTRLWDTMTGNATRIIWEYDARSAPRSSPFAVSPDGTTLAIADTTVNLWDLTTGKRKIEFPESHSGAVTAVSSSRDGKFIASGGVDGMVRLWYARTGQQLHSARFSDPKQSRICAITLSPDATLVAGAAYGLNGTGWFRVFNVSSGRSVLQRRGGFQSVVYSDDGTKLAAVSGGKAYVWNPQNPGEEQSWRIPGGGAKGIAFAPDTNTLTVLKHPYRMDFFDVATAKRLGGFPMKGPKRQIKSGVFSPDGRFVITNGLFQDKLLIWDVKSGKLLRQIQTQNTKGNVLAISPDGRIVASAGATLWRTRGVTFDHAIHLWSAADGRHLVELEPETAQVSSLAFASDGNRLISGMNNGTSLVWNVAIAHKILEFLDQGKRE